MRCRANAVLLIPQSLNVDCSEMAGCTSFSSMISMMEGDCTLLIVLAPSMHNSSYVFFIGLMPTMGSASSAFFVLLDVLAPWTVAVSNLPLALQLRMLGARLAEIARQSVRLGLLASWHYFDGHLTT